MNRSGKFMLVNINPNNMRVGSETLGNPTNLPNTKPNPNRYNKVAFGNDNICCTIAMRPYKTNPARPLNKVDRIHGSKNWNIGLFRKL